MSGNGRRGPALGVALLVIGLALAVVLSGVGTVLGGSSPSGSAARATAGTAAPGTAASTALSSASGSRLPFFLPLSTPGVRPLDLATAGAFGNTPLSAPLLGRGATGSVSPDDLANPTLDATSLGASVAAVGPTNDTIVVGATDESLAFADSGLTYTDGFSAAYRTHDGGATWSTTWIGANSSWTSSSSPSYGDASWGASSVAGSNGTALYATTYYQSCLVLGNACNSSLMYAAPSGVAVARSPTGGASWDAPQPINSIAEYRYVTGSCSGTAYSGYVQANFTDKPSVALSSDGRVAAVAWDVLGYYDTVVCVGTTPEVETFGLSDIVQVSVSLNQGATWSAARTIGLAPSGPTSVAIGPSPTDAISLVYQDSYNGTATTFPYALSVSTNRGVNWSAPADLGSSTMVHPVTSSAPDAWAVATLPELAVDSNASSPYAGTDYLTWDDNQTYRGGGDPSIAFVSGTTGGGWSGTSYVTPLGGNYRYFQPSIAVDPSGRVWLVYYAENVSNGDYQLVGQYSTTGGLTWTAPFAVADAVSAPTASVTVIGYWTGAAATSSGLYAGWTDCRTDTCEADDTPSVDAARTSAVTVAASVGGVTVTASSGGWTTSGVAPVATAWDMNADVTVSVPAWVPLTGNHSNVGVFEKFTGAVSSGTTPVTFDYAGGPLLTATYTRTAAGWVAGTVGPANSGPTVTVGGVVAPLSPGAGGVLTFNLSVEPGNVYTVAATAPQYLPFSQFEPTAIGATTTVTIVLQRQNGWIDGRLSPSDATLTVNGTVVTTVDLTTGLFNLSVGWGSYWVNATGTGLTSFSEYVSVAAGHATLVNPVLASSYLYGTVVPGNATVTIDGRAVVVAAGGFNETVGGGLNFVNATASGYAPYHSTFDVPAGHGLYIRIVLTDMGWIRGTVSPITAEVLIGGGAEPVVGGGFNVSEVGGASYNVSAQYSGFQTAYSTVTVTPGVTSFDNFTLVAVPACGSACAAKNGTTPGTSAGSTAYSFLDAALAAAAILGIALVVAAVIVWSGRRPPADSSPAGEEIYAAPDSGVPEAYPPSPPPPGTTGP